MKNSARSAQLAILTLFASLAQLSSPNHKLPSARLSSAHQFQENSCSAQLELEKNPARSTSTVALVAVLADWVLLGDETHMANLLGRKRESTIYDWA